MSRMLTPDPSLPIPEAESTEFEFVLGRRQVASVSLLALIAIGIFTTAAYMAGKGKAPVAVASAPAPAPAPIRIVEPVAAKAPVVVEAPLFAAPEKDGLYIQLGSVERGFAILMVHGARKVGYPAFVANGTNPNVFRVLVGPFNDKVAYQTAKGMFSSMGLDTFSRQYGESKETGTLEP